MSDKFLMETNGNTFTLTIYDTIPEDEGSYSFNLQNKRTAANLRVKGIRFAVLNYKTRAKSYLLPL